MKFQKVLIANRGEIAVRLIRSLHDLGIEAVAVYALDEADALHVKRADEAYALSGQGVPAYLDIPALVDLAVQAGVDAVHPGYGFLSESADFAQALQNAGITFIGPSPEHLRLFGDKVSALSLARSLSVPVIEGTTDAVSLEGALAFKRSLPQDAPVMLKAAAGGGGRGMRVVWHESEMVEAYERCASEATKAFGSGAVFVERYLPHVRHIEVQILGDGVNVVDFGERECTIQRRNQKLIEVAPSPSLDDAWRSRLIDCARKMANSVGYCSLGTFEFLVACDEVGRPLEYFFIEVNPRIQVEHPVTEAVFGIDLVELQLHVAMGGSLSALGLDGKRAKGFAIELRINMETLTENGDAIAESGVLQAMDLPGGAGVRVDSLGYTGYQTSVRYDSLLAKLIVYGQKSTYEEVLKRMLRAMGELRIEGVRTNQALLGALLQLPAFQANQISTRFLDEHLPALLKQLEAVNSLGDSSAREIAFDQRKHDPLALFSGANSMTATRQQEVVASSIGVAPPAGSEVVLSRQQGTILSVEVAAGQRITKGQTLLVLEAMKMEHVMEAPWSGFVTRVDVQPMQTVLLGQSLLCIEVKEDTQTEGTQQLSIDLDFIRDDLAQVLRRRAALEDAQRPHAVDKRRKTGQRMARENLADLCDADSFVEYGGLAIAAQRQRRSIADLLELSPADGMVCGVATVNAPLFGKGDSRCVVMSYDYTVFAGTQGVMNHRKTDRMLDLAKKWKLPVVLFAEGGGGRPGDEWTSPAGLDCESFNRLAALNGVVPTVGIAAGRCFAGNAALLGACDLIVATRSANIGMGGPAMIEGGGLGSFRPEEIGPAAMQSQNGVIDVLVDDEAEAVAIAKKYLAYFQGAIEDWDCDDQRALRSVVPENRLRAYDIRQVIELLADQDSVLELRRDFGVGMITVLLRLEGRTFGLYANNPMHLGGAIDAPAADKVARFIKLCDAYQIPMICLCDTPGMMVGPKVEETAQVRHVSRIFAASANIQVPIYTVVLRKGYGLGALAMAGGNSHASIRLVAWPTGEFGPMGLEGGVKLAYRKELLAIEDVQERKAWFDEKVAQEYEKNKALSSATYLEIDDVIDPLMTREEIIRTMQALLPHVGKSANPTRRIDVW